MIKALSELSTSSETRTVLVSLDESHTLTESCKDEPEWTPFLAVRYAMREIRDENVFFVSLSTHGKLTRIIPPVKEDISHRISTMQLKHHRPITGLAYDLMARGFLVENERRLGEYASVEGMSRFGRPL